MMQSSEIKKFVDARPFRPFRLRTNDGRVHTVHHPRLVLVTSYDVIVGKPDPDLPPPAAASSELVALESISAIEFLDEPARA
jgi:hypothetical protein